MADLLDRLADKFTVGDGCWEWTAAKDVMGYGRVYDRGRVRQATHVLHELLVGPVPSGLELDRLCRNRSCVRPAHLEAVDHHENVRRGEANSWRIAITHCPRGHAYDGTNTYWNGNKRVCRACRRLKNVGGIGTGGHHRAKTHCPAGHPYDGPNLYTDPSGRRQCRTCRADKDRERKRRRRG